MSIRTRVKEVKHLRNRYLICVLENPKLAVNLAPMGGIVESLNLGTSTGIVLSYIREQRLKFLERKRARNKV